jgi:hypothetical protein
MIKMFGYFLPAQMSDEIIVQWKCVRVWLVYMVMRVMGSQLVINCMLKVFNVEYKSNFERVF